MGKRASTRTILPVASDRQDSNPGGSRMVMTGQSCTSCFNKRTYICLEAYLVKLVLHLLQDFARGIVPLEQLNLQASGL